MAIAVPYKRPPALLIDGEQPPPPGTLPPPLPAPRVAPAPVPPQLGAPKPPPPVGTAPIQPYTGQLPTTPGPEPGPVSSFGPGDDLRFAQFNPQASERLAGMGQQSDVARGQVAGFQGYGPFEGIAPTESAQARTYLNQAGQRFQSPFERLGAPDVSGAQGYLDEAGQAARAAQFDPANYGESEDLFRRAAGEYGGAQLGPFERIGGPTDYDETADVQGLRGRVGTGVSGLYDTPNRQQLASQALERFVEEGDPAYQARIRDIGAKAAAFGRLGAGVTTTELGDLGLQREKDLNRRRAELAGETAGLELSDRLARLGATQGAYGQLAGQDLSTAGFRQGLRGEARGERGAAFGADQARANLALSRGQGLADIGSRQADIATQRYGQGGAAGQFALERARTLAGLGGQEFGQRTALADRAAAERDAATRYGLETAGGLSGLAGQEFGMEAQRRGEQVGERAARLGQAEAELGARQGVAGQLAGLEQGQYGREAAQRDELRGERGYQAGTAQQALENRIQQKQLEDALLNSQFGRQLSAAELEQRAAGQYAGQAEAGGSAASDLLEQLALEQQMAQYYPQARGGGPYPTPQYNPDPNLNPRTGRPWGE